MSGFIFSDNHFDYNEHSRKLLHQRGPDYEIVEKIGGYQLAYHIFSMKPEISYEYRINDIIIMFDGIIFNCGNDVNATTHHILECYKEYGMSFTDKLDGEYAICIVDIAENKCIFSTDVFGTKPLWYDEKKISICTYKSILEKNNCCNIERALPNTIYCYNLESGQLTYNQVHKFDLCQKKQNYDDWIESFEKSINKRASGQTVALGLSSGYDSGGIFCELIKKKFNFESVSFIAKESREILERRISLSSSAKILDFDESKLLLEMRKLLHLCEPYKEKYFDMFKDEATFGLGIMFELARNNGIRVMLSGSGGDEIISDYGFGGKKRVELSEFGGLFPKKLEDIFPWRNFFQGSLKAYLTREEYVAGVYGVQIRYPFLDVNLVQEFLWLTADLKNQYYKAPLHEYFERNNFPYLDEKVGFFLR